MKKRILAVALAATMALTSAISAMAASLADVAATGFWAAHSEGVEVTEEEVTITFKSTTDAAATDNWNAPMYVLYSADEAFAGGVVSETAGYVEYFVMRADIYGWAGAGIPNADYVGGNTATTMAECVTTTAPADWAAWLAANQAGIDCTVTAKLDGSNAVVTMTVGEAVSTATIPVDTTKTVYITLSGEKCTLTDITVVEDAPEADAPSTDAPSTDAPSTDAPEADAPATDAPSTDAPATSTGDVATAAMIVAMVGAAAAVVVLKKRVTE
ncbi:MAG: hypothetical protein E7269_03140 [Lachnospiraceae bacterium]|nr:hypothetical protein [Lachnospiraceae bacterium]